MSFYVNERTLRDGAILIYQRAGGAKGTYHARFKIDGVKGYIVKSLKTSIPADAIKTAENEYDELRFNKKRGIDVRTSNNMKFRDLWKRFYEANKIGLSIHRQKLHEGNANRYFVPFLGDDRCAELQDKRLEEYWAWRINFYNEANWKDRDIPANAARMPSQKTLQMEGQMLRQIFRWGKRLGHVVREPFIQAPKVKHTKGIERRPSFDIQEWRKLYRFLAKWSDESFKPATNKEDGTFSAKGKQRGPHALHREQRNRLRNYVLFMGASGLRPNEAKQLRWCDCNHFKDKNGVKRLKLDVRETNKTGYRETVPTEDVEEYLNRIKAQSLFTGPKDLVFCDREGKPLDNLNKTFTKVLEECGLLTDKNGKDRTVYSLRHTYATFRLLYGKVIVEDLAQNMGTSPQMIYQHYRHILPQQKAHELATKFATQRPIASKSDNAKAPTKRTRNALLDKITHKSAK